MLIQFKFLNHLSDRELSSAQLSLHLYIVASQDCQQVAQIAWQTEPKFITAIDVLDPWGHGHWHGRIAAVAVCVDGWKKNTVQIDLDL